MRIKKIKTCSSFVILMDATPILRVQTIWHQYSQTFSMDRKALTYFIDGYVTALNNAAGTNCTRYQFDEDVGYHSCHIKLLEV
jgi:hypothetical protein